MPGWKRWLRMGLLTALVVLLYFTVPVTTDLSRSEAFQLTTAIAALVLLTVGITWQIRLQMVETDRRIDGLVLALIIGVLAFAFGFYAMELRDPGQIAGLHTRLDSLYFTMSTLLTIGYGDVHAAGQLARGVVLVQMVFNVVVLTTAAATLTRQVRARAAVRVETRRAAKADGPPKRRRRHFRRTHRNPT